MQKVSFRLCIHDPPRILQRKLLRLKSACTSNRFSTATVPRILDFAAIDKDKSSLHETRAGMLRAGHALPRTYARNRMTIRGNDLYNGNGIADRPLGEIEFSTSTRKYNLCQQVQRQCGVVHSA